MRPDRAVRILCDGQTSGFFLRDRGGSVVATVSRAMHFDGTDQLMCLAHKHYPHMPILMSASVVQALLDHALEAHRLKCRPRTYPVTHPDTLSFNWAQDLRGQFYRSLRLIGHVTGDEYEAIRAMIDAGEVEAVPAYLVALAALKAKTG